MEVLKAIGKIWSWWKGFVSGLMVFMVGILFITCYDDRFHISFGDDHGEAVVKK